MTYPYEEAKFQEHLAMLRHPQYERDEAHQLRLDLRWDGDYPGESTAIVELLSPWEGKEELLRNTLGFITGNIGALYEATLAAMLPVFGPAGVGSNTEQGPVKTKADLHKARDPQDVIRMVFIKPDDVKGDIAVFSLLTQLPSCCLLPLGVIYNYPHLLKAKTGNVHVHRHLLPKEPSLSALLLSRTYILYTIVYSQPHEALEEWGGQGSL